jgi:hypothetical protein
MTYVQQNKRNLVIAAAAAAGASLAAEAAPKPRLRVPRLRFSRPRRMTTRTLVLAAVVASIPVTVTAAVVVHHALTASNAPIRLLSSDAKGNAIQQPVVGALPAADASTWSALTRPPGDAERNTDNMKALQTLQENSRFGVNAGLARQVAVRDGSNVWLMPGNGFVCIGLQPTGDPTMGAGCNTEAAARAGALTVGDGDKVLGIVPDGVRSVTVTDAGTGLRHDEPVTDNVYELAYKPAAVTLTVPGSDPVTFNVLQ